MTNEQTTPEDTTEIEHQGALPLELPEYHGRAPVGMRTALSGAGNRISREHGIGDRTVIVIEAKCHEAGHRDTDDGLLYIEKHKVVDLFELDRDAGSRMLGFLRSTYRADRDAAEGKQPLPDLGDQGYADGSGVVMTPAEVAERREDPVRMLTDEEATAVVVVFEDHSRLLWPDEFPKDTDRPKCGDKLEDGLVVELLHHETGETMAWLAQEDDDEVRGPVDRAELANVAEAAVVNEVDAGGLRDGLATATASAAGEVPDLPEADAPADPLEPAEPFAGDSSFDDAADDFDNPDNVRRLPTSGEREAEALEVTQLDVGFVDCTLPQLRAKLDLEENPDDVRRYIEAEKQGRGRGSDPRSGALDALHKRLDELTAPAAS